MSVLPGSDINLFRYCQGVIDLDAEIPDGTFDFGMSEQELDSSEISCPPIDQCVLLLSGGCAIRRVFTGSDALVGRATKWLSGLTWLEMLSR
jgi:hypothetical protein